MNKTILTNKATIELINELEIPDHEHPINNGRVPWQYVERYGNWLYQNDKPRFYYLKKQLNNDYQIIKK